MNKILINYEINITHGPHHMFYSKKKKEKKSVFPTLKCKKPHNNFKQLPKNNLNFILFFIKYITYNH